MTPVVRRRRRLGRRLVGCSAIFVVGLLFIFRERWLGKAQRLDQGDDGGRGPGDLIAKEKALSPHILFVLVDDMGFNDIGYQSTDLRGITPVLDRLAAEGVVLSQYYSMHVCTPARAALLTGRYPLRVGMQYDLLDATASWGLSLGEVLMPQYLNSVGYVSHMVGKWHLGQHAQEFLPNSRGFESFLGYLSGETDHWTHLNGLFVYDNNETFFDFGFADRAGYIDKTTGMPRRGPEHVGVYGTEAFTDRAIEVISEHAAAEGPDGKPLFLYYAAQAVHSPLSDPPAGSLLAADEALISLLPDEDRRQFARMLRYQDMSVGRVLSALEKAGMMERTLVVVASDNGGCALYGSSNLPLRGLKHSLFEGGTRVPAFVYSTSPALVPTAARGTVYAELFHVTDWLPTLGAVAGFGTDISFLDGVDQWADLTGQRAGSGSTAATVSGALSPASGIRAAAAGTVDAADCETAGTTAGVGSLSDAGLGVDPASGPRTMLIYNMDAYEINSDRTAVVVADKPNGAIRVGRYKLIVQQACQGWPSAAAQSAATALADADICGSPEGGGRCEVCKDCADNTQDDGSAFTLYDYLFDLEADPAEEHNLIDVYPEVAAELYDRMLTYSANSEPSHYQISETENAAVRIWLRHGSWMVPWWGIFRAGVGGPDGGSGGGGQGHSHGAAGASTILEREQRRGG